jgi:hypothetical protein
MRFFKNPKNRHTESDDDRRSLVSLGGEEFDFSSPTAGENDGLGGVEGEKDGASLSSLASPVNHHEFSFATFAKSGATDEKAGGDGEGGGGESEPAASKKKSAAKKKKKKTKAEKASNAVVAATLPTTTLPVADGVPAVPFEANFGTC